MTADDVPDYDSALIPVEVDDDAVVTVLAGDR